MASSRSRPTRAQEREQRVRELGMAFRAVNRAVSRLRGRDTHLGEGQLTQAQYELLLALAEHDELRAGELAIAAKLTPASVTEMLDHLVACGHVERVRSASDRRAVVTRLTAQGRRGILARRAAWGARWEQALEGFDAAELATAARVLERLAVMFEEGPPEDGCEGGAQGRKRAPKQARAA